MARHILVTTSTFPAHSADPVPSFVKDFVVNMKRRDPELKITVLAPHDKRSGTQAFTRHDEYDEYRYRYMWPSGLERLSGQGGIVPSLKRHKWLYFIVPFFLLAQIVATARIARKVDADIIHAHWIIPQGFTSAVANLVLKKPLITSIHGSDVSALNNAPAVALKRFAVNAATTVVANSSDTYARVKKLVPSRSYPTVPMGVAIGDFTPHPTTHSPLRILFIGRLSEEKGVEDLVSALAILKQSGTAFTAKIAGTGPLEADLKRQVKSMNLTEDVELIGWVAREDITSLYDWADVFVGPSVRDALGVVFIEAGAHGLPVVSTDVGGIPDVVLNGKTGLTIPPHAPSKIADAILQLVAAPGTYQQMGQEARAHIVADFSWDSVVDRYIKLYEELGAER